MTSLARDAYLENQILTAAPQQLRLMLIEGAVRFARQALCHWENAENEAAALALTRARGIVGELLSSLTADGSELTRRVAGLYLYLFQTLARAGVERDLARVREAIDVLDYERETWRLVCTQRSHQTDRIEHGSTSFEIPHGAPVAVGPEGSRAGGFVLDA